MLQLLKTSKTELDIGKILLHNFCPNFRVSNHRDSILNEWSFAAVSTNQIASERERDAEAAFDLQIHRVIAVWRNGLAAGQNSPVATCQEVCVCCLNLHPTIWQIEFILVIKIPTNFLFTLPTYVWTNRVTRSLICKFYKFIIQNARHRSFEAFSINKNKFCRNN